MQNPVFANDQTFSANGQTYRPPMAQQATMSPPAQPTNLPPMGQASTISAGQLDAMYAAPSAGPVDTGRITYDDVIVKTGGLLALVILTGAVSWIVMPGLWMVGAPVGFILAMINIFRKKISPVLITLYAVAMGVFVGGISRFYEAYFDGVVLQAVGATLAVFLATLGLFASGKVRASKRMTKIFLVALVGYVLFAIINAIMVWTGQLPAFGVYSWEIMGMPAAMVIGVLVVLLGAYSFVLDFESIKFAVEQGAPRIFSWRSAFGLLVTIIWLYLEMLRIIAASRSR